MGDLQGISKARRELEELYSGVPDESVNLTFQDLAEVSQLNNNHVVASAPPPPMDDHPSIHKIVETSNNNSRKEEVSPLTKLPSLDFNQGLKATIPHHHHHGHARSDHPIHNQLHQYHNHPLHVMNVKMDNHHDASPYTQTSDSYHHHHHRDAAARGGFKHGMDTTSMAYGDVSGMSMASMSGFYDGRRRRAGIPHSNICTVCSNYIYVFRHRCLVCGRVYCRQCVGIGMGDMAEGRKCIECLGKRFSQRYIQRAGEVGCCMGYHSKVKQEELKWAEKGPRRTGDDRYGRSGGMVMSRSMGPNPRLPASNTPTNNSSNSFVMMNSPYSPYYSPANHPLPF